MVTLGPMTLSYLFCLMVIMELAPYPGQSRLTYTEDDPPMTLAQRIAFVWVATAFLILFGRAGL